MDLTPDNDQGRPRSFRNRAIALIATSLFAFALSTAIYLRFTPAEFSTSMTSARTAGDALTAQAHVPGRILLKVKPEYRAACSHSRIHIPDLELAFTAAGFDRALRAFPKAEYRSGANSLGQPYVDLSLTYELFGDSSIDVVRFANLISHHPAVAYAEPRWVMDIMYVPNDFYYQYQWYADSLFAHDAWDISRGDSNIVIGFIDTGTSFSHEDLGGNRVSYNTADLVDGLDNDLDGYVDNYRGWDFSGGSPAYTPDNDPSFVGTGPGMDHGVLTTGVACARPDNGKGIAGIGYHTRYLPLKAGPDASTMITHGYDAIVYAADHGIDILNLSWGGLGYSQFSQDAVSYAAINHGCLLVAAAGNRHLDELVYPASYDHVISVAAISAGDAVWTGSNTTGTTFNYRVDISAFGQNLMTTAGETGYWGGATGTSMAAPLVCATAALVRAQYPNYNNIQAGELVRVSALNHYGRNPSPQLHEKLGLGRLHAGRALSLQNLVSARIDTLAISDNDNNIAEPFDTLSINPRFINYLSAIPSLNVSLSTSATDFIEILQATASTSAMGTLGTAFPQQPFRIVVKKEVTEAKTVFLRFGFSSGTYNDYQYVVLSIRPRRIDLVSNLLQTSLTSFCGFGFADIPFFYDGIGLSAGNVKPILRDGGLLIGQPSSGILLSGAMNDTLYRDQDFAGIGRPIVRMPGMVATKEVESLHDDRDAGSNRLGLEVKQRAYQDAGSANSNFIILRYDIRNTSSQAINGLFAGLQMSWDAGWASIDQAKFYTGANAIAARFSQGGQKAHVGVALLSDGQVRAKTKDFNQTTYTRSERLSNLAAAPITTVNTSNFPVQTISEGSFNLQAGAVHTVAFAIVYGADSVSMRLNAITARKFFHCNIMAETPSLALPSDTVVCTGQSVTLPGGPSGYTHLWSTGAHTPTIDVTQAGTYSVQVTSPHGCTAQASVQVSMRDLATLHSLSLPSQGVAQTLLPFEVSDPGNSLTTWNWNFGDGILGIGNPLQHAYASPGTYSVSIEISDGSCLATLSGTVEVAALTGNGNALEAQIEVYPNPTEGPFKVKLPDGLQRNTILRLFDSKGGLVDQRPLNPQAMQVIDFELSGKPAGTYLLRVESEGAVFTRKVVKR